MNVLAVEMEAAGLYGVAAEKGARALTIATVSDHIRTGEATSSDERQQTFDDMVRDRPGGAAGRRRLGPAQGRSDQPRRWGASVGRRGQGAGVIRASRPMSSP